MEEHFQSFCGTRKNKFARAFIWFYTKLLICTDHPRIRANTVIHTFPVSGRKLLEDFAPRLPNPIYKS